MDFSVSTLILVVVCITLGYLIAIFTGMQHRVTEIFLSRQGLEVRTTNDPVCFEIMGTLADIDDDVCTNVRIGATGHMLLDPEKVGMTFEVMLANHKAYIVLLCATYENHHTRKLDKKNGVELYIMDKVNDIANATNVWRHKIPTLNDSLIESYVCYWIKNVLIPHLRNACCEKIEFYNRLLARKSISNSLREEIQAWLTKNERYLLRIDELEESSGIRNRSSIYSKIRTQIQVQSNV